MWCPCTCGNWAAELSQQRGRGCGAVLVGSFAWRVFPHPSLVSADVGISNVSIPPVLTCRLSALSTELIYVFHFLLHLQTTESDGCLPILSSTENAWEELSKQLALSAPRDAGQWMPLCFIPLHYIMC